MLIENEDYIKYSSNTAKFKYRMIRQLASNLPFPCQTVDTPNIKIHSKSLFILKSFPWDGVSGPAFDSDDTMEAGCVHDAFYSMIREGLLPLDPYKHLADEWFRQILLYDGVHPFRAWYMYKAVDIFGKVFALRGAK